MDRKKKVIYNLSFSLLYEAVAIVCGFILPRLILSSFGSAYNGLIATVTQFISYVALLKNGIGGVTRAALYKPLVRKDDKEISAIINATSRFMKKVAIIFSVGLIIYAALYPFLVRKEFGWFFTFSLILIIGISTFAQCYFAVVYQLLLKADQREYISMIINIVVAILNTVAAAAIMKMGFGIHFVKFGSAMVFLLIPVLTSLYVKKHYHIDKKVPPNNSAISQRWDSFAHQLANFVHGNTDIIILTFFTNTLEISVYSVYYLVLRGVRKGIIAITVGVEDAFGNMIAKKEENVLGQSFELYECIMFGITTVVMTVTFFLCVPFVRLYTAGIMDANYIRPVFCYCAIAGEFFYCVRTPYESIVRASGHYKQTRNGALLETAINIVISLILVVPFGIVGVTVGTLIAMAFRTMQYSYYVKKNIIWRSKWKCIKQWIVSILVIICSSFIYRLVIPEQIENYSRWILCAIAGVFVVGVIEIIMNMIFNRKIVLRMISLVKSILPGRE